MYVPILKRRRIFHKNICHIQPSCLELEILDVEYNITFKIMSCIHEHLSQSYCISGSGFLECISENDRDPQEFILQYSRHSRLILKQCVGCCGYRVRKADYGGAKESEFNFFSTKYI
jgi:hypothetical protein